MSAHLCTLCFCFGWVHKCCIYLFCVWADGLQANKDSIVAALVSLDSCLPSKRKGLLNVFIWYNCSTTALLTVKGRHKGQFEVADSLRSEPFWWTLTFLTQKQSIKWRWTFYKKVEVQVFAIKRTKQHLI